MATSSQPPVIIEQPLLNSIPLDLLPRFNPTYVEYYSKYSAGRLATHQVPIEAYRRDPAAYTISYGREIVDTGSLLISEEKCPVEGGEITVRIFQPAQVTPGQAPRPAYINFHGGGWVFGGLATDVDLCKRLALEVGCVVFDVDYRLAPEFKFPVPVDDCWTAFNWVRDTKAAELNLDLDKVAIGGCSSGGHLAAVTAHRCRDADIPLAFQLLGIPVCDLHVFTPMGELRPDCPYESYREMYHSQPLPAERMMWFHKKFLGCPRPKELDDDWKVSPIRAPSFEGLAPALIVTAEMDVVRDEGEAYGRKMREAGCEAEVIRVGGAPHAFMQMDGIMEIGQLYNRESVRALRCAFGVVV
ncbi:related to esterase [Cephalotrichum gorgonifer]|uniref:Related to esterase n=1 Tax=Cephalotrichum gorgonifer TaxID=2041049 RepID=A0AAE8N7X4_9PEZI|nr:related to esterase [Cephalotrichum gorgonifer]